MSGPKGPIAIAAAVAGSGGYARQLIDEQDVTAAATITFSSIPQTYQNLVLEHWLATSSAVVEEDLKWWLNNNQNVSAHYLQDDGRWGGSVIGGHAGNNNAVSFVTGSGARRCYSKTKIPDYTLAHDNHFGHTEAFWSRGASSIAQSWRLNRVNLNAAITRIDLFATGTLTGLVRLYGEP